MQLACKDAMAADKEGVESVRTAYSESCTLTDALEKVKNTCVGSQTECQAQTSAKAKSLQEQLKAAEKAIQDKLAVL